jgi:hypothetical protein
MWSLLEAFLRMFSAGQLLLSLVALACGCLARHCSMTAGILRASGWARKFKLLKMKISDVKVAAIG